MMGQRFRIRPLKIATPIARPCKAQIILFHVVDLIEDPDTMIFGNNKELIEKAKLMNLVTTIENREPKRAQKTIKRFSEQGNRI